METVPNSTIKKSYARFCVSPISVISGTIFQATKMNIADWFRLIRMMLTHGRGMSAYRMSNELGIYYKTVWLCAMKIRAGQAENTEELLTFLRHHINHELGGKSKHKKGFYNQLDTAINSVLETLSKKNNSEEMNINKVWKMVSSSLKKKYRNVGKTYLKFYLAEINYHQRNINNPNIFEDYLSDILSKEKCINPEVCRGDSSSRSGN